MSFADTISNKFSSIGDKISNWSNSGVGAEVSSKVTSYPMALGDDSQIDFNDGKLMNSVGGNTEATEKDDRVKNYAGGRSSGIEKSPGDPFILFEFIRIADDQPEEQALEIKSIDFSSLDIMAMVSDVADNIKTTMESWKPNRKIAHTVAMYMPPAIAIADSMSYEEKTRKAVQLFDSLIGDDARVGEDAVTLGIEGANYAMGLLGAKLGGLIGGAGALTTTDLITDEAQRIRGKVINPAEYMTYKSTGLRSFGFTWKMLPESADESMECEELIRIFRSSAHAHKPQPNSMTLYVPDQVAVSFHGVDGLINLPPLYTTSVSVTFNPSSTSFFKENGMPVEIDLSVGFTEIMPIYRTDILDKGF